MPDGLTIRIRTNGLWSVVTELRDGAAGMVADDAETLDVHVPMELKRCGGRKEIILPPDAHTATDVGPRRPIVLALARAYKWQKMIDTGEAESLEQLAEHYGVDRSYVSRISMLASLAPDIVEAVLDGDDPESLSLNSLRQGIPTQWAEQRRAFDSDACARS